MSKAAFFFDLYDQDREGILNNIDLHTMATELFLLMNLLDINFNAWETLSNLITLSAEHSNDKEVIDHLSKELQDDDNEPAAETNKMDAEYFVLHINKVHNALMGPEAPSIELTLPSLRMIVLTEDRLEKFIQIDLPQSFKLQKAFVERQKGLGHEIFEALFIEGRRLANQMAYPATIDAIAPLPSTFDQHLSLSNVPPVKSPISTRSVASTNDSINHHQNNGNLEDDYEMM
jgi:hypothetical protein